MGPLQHRWGEATCPSRGDLLAFGGGDLPPEALEAIAGHLARCPRCLSALGAVEDNSRTLRDIRRALQGPAPDPFAADPEYRRMEGAAIALHPAGCVPGPGPDDPPAPDLTPPFTLGQYQVLERIGRGGMGSVYRALHPRLKKEFAVKVLRAERTADPRAVARFQREMEAIGRLDHHHIVRATDAGEAGGLHFLVMELVAGVDLSRLVHLCGPLPVADACELVRQAAVGLQCAHEHGLVHRDVKPSNLLLSATGEVKVLDLGLALLNQGGPAGGELTASGQVMGTPDYTAPEQWEASHAVDIRADIYSLGCTLYKLLVGRPPFAGPVYASAPRKMAAHLGEPLAPVRAHRPDVPEPLGRLLASMVAKKPADRPGTPGEVARALAPFCRGADLPALAARAMGRLSSPESSAVHAQPTVPEHGTPATPEAGPRGPVPADTRRRRGWRRLAAALGGLAALLAVALALAPWPQPRDGERPAPPGPPPPERGRWQDLLGRQPAPRLWVPEVAAHWHHDPDAQTLFVQTSSYALIRLGETNAGGYKLEVGFRQPRWVGGVGVYFGGRPAGNSGDFHFQLIDLGPAGDKDRPLTLTRSTGTVWSEPGARKRVETRGFASHRVHPPDAGEQRLELEVKPRGLVRVRWNGQPCPELVADTDAARAYLKDAQDRGEFGIYCVGSNGTVTTARFMPTE